MYYDISAVPMRGNNIFKAEAAIKIHDVIAVQQIHIIQSWNGKTFVGMPQRENRQKQKNEDLAHPITGNFKYELETAILEKYYKKLENQHQRRERQKVGKIKRCRYKSCSVYLDNYNT